MFESLCTHWTTGIISELIRHVLPRYNLLHHLSTSAMGLVISSTFITPQGVTCPFYYPLSLLNRCFFLNSPIVRILVYINIRSHSFKF